MNPKWHLQKLTHQHHFVGPVRAIFLDFILYSVLADPDFYKIGYVRSVQPKGMSQGSSILTRVSSQKIGYAGLGIIAKAALNKGMSHFAFSIYRNLFAAAVFEPFAAVLERKIRPNLTFSVFYKIVLIALLEPVIDQNLYYAAMKYMSATFALAMTNMLPAMTFLLAWIFSLSNGEATAPTPPLQGFRFTQAHVVFNSITGENKLRNNLTYEELAAFNKVVNDLKVAGKKISKRTTSKKV